jgi:hypothetical protein
VSTIDELLLVHHCHTDIGYTHDQPALWDLQRRFIDTALDLADRDADVDAPHAFRWTVETTAPLLRWLESADADRIDLFRRLEAAGRIEVTGMLANITPLYGPAQTAESLRPVQRLREEFGFDVRHAMNCDVNGQNWPLVDALLDAGIDCFSMAINEHFGGSGPRPDVFRWEGPSGRELFALNGFHYSTGWQLGIGRDADELAETWWPRVEDRLDAVEYPLDSLLVQSFHPFGDNGPAFEEFTTFVREWNDRPDVADGDLPTIRMATPADFWEEVRERADDLPVRRGDWTDYWNFGAASSARELAVNRESRRRLLTADALEAGLSALGADEAERDPTRRAEQGTRSDAWWALNFFDEHTWGADTAVWNPEQEDVRSQWYHKAGYAYDARSRSLMLQRDAVAELARHVEVTDDE